MSAPWSEADSKRTSALVASLALITYVPEIVLFVPRLLGLIQ